ncbi:MAG: hypothetical protein AAGU19_03130 [Prolixibacteraceae bacterium]
MKKLLLLLLTTGILMTGCIENEESESVKQIRLGQAALLQAQADAALALANSQVAMDAAKAAMLAAETDFLKAEAALITEETRHQAAMNALEEDLRTAATAAAKEALEKEMQLMELYFENEMIDLEKDKVRAQTQLLEKQYAYQITKNEYDEAMAKAAADHELAMKQIAAAAKDSETEALVTGYEAAYEKWSNQYNFVTSMEDEILDLQHNLTLAKNDAAPFIDYLRYQREQARERLDYMTRELAMMQNISFGDIKVTLEAEKTRITTAVTAIQQQLVSKAASRMLAMGNLEQAELAYEIALDEYKAVNRDMKNAEADTLEAYNNYFVYKNWKRKVQNEPLLDVNGEIVFVPLAEAVDAEKGDVDANGNYLSLHDAAEVVLAGDKAKEAEDVWKAALETYQALPQKWEEAKAARDEAKVAYDAALASLTSQVEEMQKLMIQLSLLYEELDFVSEMLEEVNNFDEMIEYAEQQVAEAQVELTDWTAILSSAQVALAEGKSFDYYDRESESYEGWNFDAYIRQLEKMQTRLIGEKAILELYKADLDSWAAKLKAALVELG